MSILRKGVLISSLLAVGILLSACLSDSGSGGYLEAPMESSAQASEERILTSNRIMALRFAVEVHCAHLEFAEKYGENFEYTDKESELCDYIEPSKCWGDCVFDMIEYIDAFCSGVQILSFDDYYEEWNSIDHSNPDELHGLLDMQFCSNVDHAYRDPEVIPPVENYSLTSETKN